MVPTQNGSNKSIEISWDYALSGNFPDTPARQAFRNAVAEVAASAKEALPDSHTRIDAAVKMVLQGDVKLLEDGRASVASQSNGQTVYHVVNGECGCKDFHKAPAQFCKHRLAYAIQKRANSLVQQRLHAETAADPEENHRRISTVVSDTTDAENNLDDIKVNSPSPSPSVPQQFIAMITNKPFVTYQGLLALAHDKGLVTLSARFISVSDTLALAEATATFQDGRAFQECADASPANCNAKVRLHFPRVALTRAKCRALRDGLNIGMVAIEELEN